MKKYKRYFKEYEEYVGQHEAPTKEDNSPLYNVSLNGSFPKDFYTGHASDYRAYEPYDNESINIILKYHNRTTRPITIYRAIPDFNYEVDDKIKQLNNALSYYYTYNFFPMTDVKNSGRFKYFYIIDNQYEKTPQAKKKGLSYDGYKKQEVEYIEKEIDNLGKERKPKPIINKGDWVSINKKYAMDHGRSNLNGKYKILSKTVRADQIWTDGNSIHEWGYDPS